MLKEHWEEGLRGLEGYQHRELPMYNADTPDKVAQVATDLAEADYLHFYSSRLFGTIPRLPDDYPIPYNMTRAFYPLLFSGRAWLRARARRAEIPLAAGRKPRQRRLRPSWADAARGHRRLCPRRPPRAHGLRRRELQRLRPSAGAGLREHGASQSRPAAGDSRPSREARWAPVRPHAHARGRVGTAAGRRHPARHHAARRHRRTMAADACGCWPSMPGRS